MRKILDTTEYHAGLIIIIEIFSDKFEMKEFFKVYPYFSISIILFLFSLFTILISGKKRILILFSGLSAVPFAFSSFFFTPEYWDPVRITGTPIGVEDILFSFSTGCIAYGIAVALRKHPTDLKLSLTEILRRYFSISNICFFFAMLLWGLGLSIMTSVIIVILSLGVIFFYFFPELRIVIVKGTPLFLIFYGIILYISVSLFPHFSFQWTELKLSGMNFLGFPVEEMIWAFAFGAVWPAFIIYITEIDLKLKKKPKGDCE